MSAQCRTSSRLLDTLPSCTKQHNSTCHSSNTTPADHNSLIPILYPLLPIFSARTFLAMSASPTPLNVLITGAGLVGKAVLDALLDPDFNTTTADTTPVKPFLLVRPASLADVNKRASIDQYAAKGAAVVEGDVQDVAGMTHLLQHHAIHTVVCVVGFTQGALHYPLIEACKAAGTVRHFLPSDYTIDIDAVSADSPMYDAFAQPKQAVHAAIRQSGMEWTFIATGVFVEAALLFPTAGVDLTSRTVTAPVSFDTVMTLTPLHEIGVLTAAAIVDSSTRNSQLYLGRQYTFEQLAQALEAATGEPIIRRVRTVEEMQAAIKQQPMNIVTRLALAQTQQTATTWPDSQTYRHAEVEYPSLLTVAQKVIKGSK